MPETAGPASSAPPMRGIAHDTSMVRAGSRTVAERRRLLEHHRVTVGAAIDELTEALHVLDAKITHYDAAEQGIDVGCPDIPLRHVAQLG